jgi:hypothetical protein
MKNRRSLRIQTITELDKTLVDCQETAVAAMGRQVPLRSEGLWQGRQVLRAVRHRLPKISRSS